MGEFKPMASGDGSWAHAPEDAEATKSQMPPGPFQVTDMPARPPVPPAKSPQTRHLLGGVAGPTGGEE